jgi:hypothetical protein
MVYFEKTSVQVSYNWLLADEGFVWKNFEMAESNIVWSASDPKTAVQKIQDSREKRGFDKLSLVADHGFKDPSHGNFSVRKESPLYQLGIKPLHIKRCRAFEATDKIIIPDKINRNEKFQICTYNFLFLHPFMFSRNVADEDTTTLFFL